MIRVLVLVAALLVPTVAAAQPHPEIPDGELYRCKNTTGDVVVSFKPEIEVKELLAWAYGFTCKAFILDPKFVTSRRVTIMVPNKQSRAEAWQTFLVALQTMSYTVVKKGNALRVVEAQTARNREVIPITRNPDGSDQLVRYVYKPNHAASESLMPAFTTLKSDAGEVQQIGTMLLVTDYASHVKEMITLAKLVDVPKGAEGLYLMQLKFADAKGLADKLPNLLGVAAVKAPDPKAAAPTAARIVADERTNTLIIAATDAGYERVKALVDRLDIELEIEGGAKFHVYKLSSAIAEDLAKTLNEAISGQQQRTTPPSRPGVPPPPVAQEPSGIEGQVRVIGDKLSNQLIIMSSGRDYLAIKELIRALDLPRRQVFIEVLVMEVSANNGLTIGASGHAGLPGDSGLMVGGVQLPEFKSTDVKSSLGNAQGLVGGLIGNTLKGSQSLFGVSIPSYALLFQTLASRGHARVVSRPFMLGIDNKPQKQSVGTDIAYERGQLSGFGATQGAVQRQFERKPLPHEIEITPHISADDTVLLDVEHLAEEAGGNDQNGQPIWHTRKFKTSIVVRDQHTVVVGGLTQEREIRSESKVPLLGDIPVLGYLFKYKTTTKRKTSLLVMLTPYIIKDHMDLQLIQQRKLREHEELASSLRWLENTPYIPKIDYTRKRGLVEEINRTLIAVDEDIAARDSIRQLPGVRSGPVQPDTP